MISKTERNDMLVKLLANPKKRMEVKALVEKYIPRKGVCNINILLQKIIFLLDYNQNKEFADELFKIAQSSDYHNASGWWKKNVVDNPFINPFGTVVQGWKSYQRGEGLGTALLTSMTPGMAWERIKQEKKEAARLATESNAMAAKIAEQAALEEETQSQLMSEANATQIVDIEDSNKKAGVNTGTIVGVIALVGLLTGGAYFIIKSLKNKGKE